MMSQNRQEQLAQRRNHLDLQINLLAEQENTEMLRLLRMICVRLEIPLDSASMEALEQATQPEHLIEQIERTVEHKDKTEGGVERTNSAKADSTG